ncbi:HSP20-like chaperone [Aspergillus pseudodeflectus]|uniref:HSP20-like chaperone n=1 Tax=Aspergillus pseudodeflectus TaxID=176178 RepID=A0ABR4JE60_9EURO
MSLFQTFPFSTGEWSPLFTLLDDYDNHRSRKGQGPTPIRSFAPRFDVRETKDAYHLDGELPGIQQKDIDIEFTDPQTLVVKGRVEREYSSETAPSGEEQQKQEKQEKQEKPAEGQGGEVAKSGDKQVSKTGPKPRYWVSERSVGEFQRAFSFPERVNQDEVKASLKDGILSLVVPKAAPPASKKITIQ